MGGGGVTLFGKVWGPKYCWRDICADQRKYRGKRGGRGRRSIFPKFGFIANVGVWITRRGGSAHIRYYGRIFVLPIAKD